MILESVLSCTYLLLTSGSCLYILFKTSYDKYSKILPHLTCASFGIITISARSLIVLIYKLLVKKYSFDPLTIQIEEERNKLRHNTFDQLLGTLGMASLIYSLYCHHDYCLIGGFIVSGLSIYDFYELIQKQTRMQAEEILMSIDISTSLRTSETSEYITLLWVLACGSFAYTVSNNYALVANYPYLLTAWIVPTESFYQGWTIRRTINDYMMAAYVILMTEALRQSA